MPVSAPDTTDCGPPTAAEVRAGAGFGLYVHWPFCRAKCPYCDFNSHVRETVDQSRWRAALLAELDHYASETNGRSLGSIFFGGGTPSLMPPDTVAAVIAAARTRWQFTDDCEITLEANPTSVEAGRFAEFAAAGVNRVSLGVQSFDDRALAFLGRQHSAAEARAALEIAARHFARFSFDLIYARPGQGAEAWRQELDQALALAGDHLSLYQLTIEAGTVFEGAVRRGEFAPLAADPAGDLFELTQAAMAAAGRPAYEISNHARPGAQSRHNLTYWRGGEYVGIGPGAHGRLWVDGARTATRQHRAPEAWLVAVEAGGHASRTRERLAPDAVAAELLLLGLRLTDGIERARFCAIAGADPLAFVDSAACECLVDGGFLAVEETHLRATAAGRQRLDAVLTALLA